MKTLPYISSPILVAALCLTAGQALGAVKEKSEHRDKTITVQLKEAGDEIFLGKPGKLTREDLLRRLRALKEDKDRNWQ